VAAFTDASSRRPSQAKKDARKAKHTKKVEIPVTKAMKKAKKHMGDLDDLDEDL
jgi:G:T/U-mismatch repair DNA glycosylase